MNYLKTWSRLCVNIPSTLYLILSQTYNGISSNCVNKAKASSGFQINIFFPRSWYLL